MHVRHKCTLQLLISSKRLTIDNTVCNYVYAQTIYCQQVHADPRIFDVVHNYVDANENFYSLERQFEINWTALNSISNCFYVNNIKHFFGEHSIKKFVESVLRVGRVSTLIFLSHLAVFMTSAKIL